MPTEFVRQTKFTTGEVDVQNFNRTEFEDYLTAAQSLLNCEVGTTGLAKKRKGTQFLIDVTPNASANSALFDFNDKNNQPYLLLMSPSATWVYIINADGSMTLYTPIPIVTPYLVNEIQDVDWTIDNDSIIFTHPKYAPQRIYATYPGSVTTFNLQSLNIGSVIYPPPAYDFGNINYNQFTVTYSGGTGPVLTFQFTGLGSDPGFTNDWIGGQILGIGNSPEQPIGYAIITAVSYSAGTTTFTANVQIPFQATGFPTVGSQYIIRQPAFSSALGFPSKTIFYQNRLWFANTATLNNTLFGSRINQPLNFDVGSGGDADAIIYTIGLSDSGPINWLNAGKQLEIYTPKYEFAAPQEQNIGLTPSTFSIRQQSAYGASSLIKPSTYINDSYYVNTEGNAIINFHYDGIGQTYTSTNISLHSTHLVKNPISSAIIRGSDTNQDNFIYYLNPDSTITAFQFSLENKLAALTPVDFNQNPLNGVNSNSVTNNNAITVQDLVAINNEIYMLKFLVKSGRFVIEKFTSDLKIDSWSTRYMSQTGVVSGLVFFENYWMQAIINGQDYGQYLVQGGTITVEGTFSQAQNITLGILFPVRIIPMYIFAGAQQYAYFKNISRVFVDYYNSLNFTVNGMRVNYLTFTDVQHQVPLHAQSGTAVINPVDGWNRFSTITIYQNAPFDLNIISVGYQVNASII
jgi:hypothetical protein